jgi:hypothetical protein
VVPRWLGRVEGLPTDPSLWSSSSVRFPQGWPSRWSCALSGRTLVTADGRLDLAELFGVLPAALLLAEPGA